MSEFKEVLPMERSDSIELLTFGLKLLGTKSKKNILISAGKLADKARLLPVIRKLSQLEVDIYATKGTRSFLSEQGINCQEIYKVNELSEPNIRSFLLHDRLDLIINILTGDNDYDENSDNKLIRSLSITNGIPLITDVDVAILTLEDLTSRRTARQDANWNQPWNLRREFMSRISDNGGYACYHAHFDKAYLISMENLKLGQVDMQKKWALYKYLKENYTHEDLVQRISRAVEVMIEQDVRYCRTMVDADSTVKLLPVTAALAVKESYRDKIQLEVGIQPLQGVLEKDSRRYYDEACEMADFLGGLPSKDRPQPEQHLDHILGLAKRLNKPVDVHVDQENNPFESESELLALKTIEHGLEGRVSAIHAISISAKPSHEQDRIIRLMKEAGLSVVICPSAAISMKPLNLESPVHNSIAPLTKLMEANVPVYLGVDNICDLFMPLVDGDMWFECRMLMEACRFYDIDRVAQIASDKSGFTNSSTVQSTNLMLTT